MRKRQNHPKLPNAAVSPSFLDAFRTIVSRIETSIRKAGNDRLALPVRMVVAGGIAVHFYTAVRTTRDVDATLSHRMLLPDNLEASYRDADDKARLLYFDRQYNDTFGLLHQDANKDSIQFPVPGIDPKVVEVRLLSPVDLAVSKLSRFADHDRDDIKALAACGLLKSSELRKRAEEALQHYIGDPAALKTSIAQACELVARASSKSVRRAPGSGK
jgi:hypothetical protein